RPRLYAFSASSDGVVASSTGVVYFCTELSDSPSLLRKLTAAASRALSTASLPAACSCASASTSPVLQFTAFMPITYWLPSPAIEPVSIALLPERWQTSRVTSGVNRSPTGRPISFKVSLTLSAEIRPRKGDCSSCTESPCFSVSSNMLSPVLFSKSERTIVSLSATQEQTLRDAQIERAGGLVAAATTDATNLYIVLTARSLNPNLRIIARASEAMAAKHLQSAGADSVVSPYVFAGQRIAHSFLRPHVVSFLDAATTHLGMDLEIGEIAITPRSPFA